jgi:cytochrome c nitrite reductase small subunit
LVHYIAKAKRMTKGASVLVIAALVGVVCGVGIFTFGYAEGGSYFSPDPRACANCHIMNDEYASWSKGPHHAAATCADCHLPHDFIGKYLAKAENGYHHSKAFTLEDFHEPIMIKPKNKAILEQSCLHCHGDFVHDIAVGGRSDTDAVMCVHCHRGVGHGR